MQNEIRDREYAKFRAASPGELSKVAVVVEQDPSNPIPITIVSGTNRYIFDESLTDPDVEKTILSYTITDASLGIKTVNLSCHIEGKTIFFINGGTIATSRTAPGKPDCEIKFDPPIEVVLNDVIEVKFKARPQSAIAEVESYINAVIN